MKIKIEGEFKKGFISLARCSGEISISLLGGNLAEKFILTLVEEDILNALKQKGFKGKICINAKEYIVE